MPSKKLGSSLAIQSEVCYNPAMDLKPTNLSFGQSIKVFDALHEAISGLNKAYEVALKGDTNFAADLWSGVCGPAIDLCLSVTGKLLDEAARIREEESFRKAVSVRADLDFKRGAEA